MSPKPLRILHLTAGSDAGGLSRYIHDLSAALQRAGHEVTVAGERGAWHELFEAADFSWIDAPLKGGPWKLASAVRQLREWLASHPVDVIHAHYRRPTLVARRLQSAHRPPILYTLHLSDLKLSWPWRTLSDFGDHTHVPSEEARRWIIAAGHVPASRVSLIPHGIDRKRFPLADEAQKRSARLSLGLPSDERIAAFVGRLDYPKNSLWLIDILRRLPRLHLAIAGEGPDEPRLRRIVADYGLEPRAHFLGYREPLPVYQAADALLLPSIREGFSLVCAEAMSVGVPVLRTRTAGTEELIVEGVTGRSVPVDQEIFTTEAVQFLSLPTEALRKMGAAASSHIQHNFGFDRQIEQTLALYRSLATLSHS